MDREYELFERLTDGSPIWHGSVTGLRDARLKLQEIAKTTTNECLAIYLPTGEIVARLNVGLSRGAIGKPLVFQIAYDERLAIARSEVLRLHGYEVVSVIGNEAAKIVLSLPQNCDLFIIGHSGAEEDRKEMVVWLKTKYPGVRILALNPGILELSGAHHNVKLNGPETWLPVIASALGGHHESRNRP